MQLKEDSLYVRTYVQLQGRVMNLMNRRHVILYMGALGILCYVLNACLSAIFIVVLPISSDAIVDYHITRSSEMRRYEERITYREHIDFKNDFERRKYNHNEGMVKRSKYIYVSVFCLAVLATTSLFPYLPSWRQEFPGMDMGAARIIAALAIAFACTFAIPRALGLILPPPVEWFPQVLVEINDAQVEAKLAEFQALSP